MKFKIKCKVNDDIIDISTEGDYNLPMALSIILTMLENIENDYEIKPKKMFKIIKDLYKHREDGKAYDNKCSE